MILSSRVMRKRVVSVLILALSMIFSSCQYLPFWPFGREEEKPSEDVVHLASNFCGVLVPDRGKLYGCKWYRDSTYNNELTRCLGIWERDVETGAMREVWGDTMWEVRGYELSRNFRYLLFVVGSREQWDAVRLMLLDLETGDLDSISSIANVGRGAVSPYTPKRFYTLSVEQWGNVDVLWSIDFRTHSMARETSVVFPNGFYILPGAKGDSVFVDRIGSNLFPVNYVSMLGIFYVNPPDSFLLKDLKTGKTYRLTVLPPKEMYWFIFPEHVWWVHDQDSLLICTDWGGYHYPKRYDLWLIKNVTKHLQEVVGWENQKALSEWVSKS